MMSRSIRLKIAGVWSVANVLYPAEIPVWKQESGMPGSHCQTWDCVKTACSVAKHNPKKKSS